MVTCATTVTYERCPTHESYHTIQDMAWRTRGGGRLRDDIYVTLSRSRLRSGAFYARDAAAHQYSPLRAKHLQDEYVWVWLHSKKAYTRRGGVGQQHTCTKEGPREEPRWLAMHHSPAFCCETGRERHASSIPTPSSSMWERTQGEADMSTAAFVGKAGGLISCAHHE